MTLMFENLSRDMISDFELRLMDIDGVRVVIPEVDYDATVSMSASEFQRICRDLSIIGDTGALLCHTQCHPYSNESVPVVHSGHCRWKRGRQVFSVGRAWIRQYDSPAV